MKEQLTIPLPPLAPYSLSFFVPHSGVAEAVGLLREAVEAVLRDPREFRSFYLFGGAGAGKSHLAEGIRLFAKERGLIESKVSVFEADERDAAGSAVFLSRPEIFISSYERARREGGLVILAARKAPAELTSDPHLLSRFRAGPAIMLDRPREEELRAVLEALFERRNLRISPKMLDFLVSRLPADPLSFAQIVAKIDGFLWARGRPTTQRDIRRAVEGPTKR